MRARTKPKSLITLVLTVLIVVPWPLMPSAVRRSVHWPSAGPSQFAALGSLIVYSDFDGDNQLDRAELLSNGGRKSVHISLSSSRGADLTFDAGPANCGSLLAVDIDHDNDLDLVWVSQKKSQPSVVWINDGRGRFERDTDHHAAELAVLLGSDADPSVSQNQKVSNPCGVPTPSFSSDLALAGKPDLGDLPQPSATGSERHHDQAIYLSYLRKRGPPPALPRRGYFIN